ncbi:biotin/lipoyl-binding protein [Thermopolyspora sp. NPDC052614]|uniref:efflux RND transporter periplasmic adaptor subunit n=1 Tax=Thermopolyspora sp. NPDC052614 TaxID=3155682 RepID=UPI00341B37BE
MYPRGKVPLLMALVGLLAAVGGCTADEAPSVEIGQVGRSAVSEIVEAPATVGARATATLRSPAQGTIAKLYVQDGDKVDKGEILAKIDSPQAEDQLKQARDADRQASRPVSFGALPSAGGLRLSSASLTGGRFTARLDQRVRKDFARARAAARKVDDKNVRNQLLAAIDAAESQHKAHQRALAEITRNLSRSVNRLLSQVTGQLSAGLGGLSSSMSSLQAASRAQTQAAVKAAESTVKGLVIRAPFAGVVTLGGASGGGGASLGALAGQLPAGLAGQAGALAGGGALPGVGGSNGGGVIATGVPVSAGDAIVTVTDVSKLTLSADVDETDVLLVREGVQAEAELDAVTGATYRAQVTGVGVTPKEGTTGGVSYAVRLKLGKGTFDDGSPAPVPKPGMSAVVRLTVRDVPDAVSVPASAIVSSGRESVVWVVRGSGETATAERRVVKLGAQGDAVVEITDGVKVGERVVVKGADTVRQGQTLP